MINNDVLRAVRYMLDLSEDKVAAVLQLAAPDAAVDRRQVKAWLLKDDEADFAALGDLRLAQFLDGLITFRRGAAEGRAPRAPERRLSNNLVLKKLRIAFELRDEDLHAVLAAGGFPVSRPELSALFRQPGHANYRPCGDQLLRHFLRGLTLRLRGG